MHESLMLFEPLDVLSVRDGRPFSAGASATPTATSVFPTPSTMFGAAADAIGAMPIRVRGPLLASQQGEQWEACFPTPHDVVIDLDAKNQEVQRLNWALDEARDRPAVAHEHGPVVGPKGTGATPPDSFINNNSMKSYLGGNDPRVQLRSLQRVERQHHVGLAIGHESMLYHASMIRLRSDQRLAVFVETQDELPRVTKATTLGAKGRPFNVSIVDPDKLTVPAHGLLEHEDATLVSVTLTTPGIFRNGWVPPRPDGGTLVGACTGSAQPISRKNPSGGNQRWRVDWAVPAGSTYVFRFSAAEHARRFADKLHLRCLKPDYKPQRSQGFGMCLIGKAGT